MSCTNKHRQKESAERSKECNMSRFFTKQLLCHLYQPIHTTRGLHDASASNGCYNDVYHISRRTTRFHTETQNENRKTDARNGTQCQTAVT